VVDDNERMRVTVVKLMHELGYETIEAADGPSALRVLSGDAKIDLLFTDVVMPGGMTGYDLSSSARRVRPELKVLFTSGFPAAAQSGQGPFDAIAPLLSKPYRRHDLARNLRGVLDGGWEGAG
jgi:two-component system cell cycle sensor histidine kinase/response regulator CckA